MSAKLGKAIFPKKEEECVLFGIHEGDHWPSFIPFTLVTKRQTCPSLSYVFIFCFQEGNGNGFRTHIHRVN